MITIEGRWYDGERSRAHAARLSLYADGTVRLELPDEVRSYRFFELAVSPRVGRTPRRVRFPDGGELETPDNEGVDRALAQHGAQRAGRWLHGAESHLRIVGLATLVVLATVGAAVLWGIPALARVAAFALPAESAASVGQGALELLDETYFAPSRLDAETRAHLEALFAEVVPDDPQGYRFSLELRAGGLLGANAFALPSGAVVLTDEMVALAEKDGELAAVLAHEVGHVVHRHALRQAIQSSMVGLTMILVTGDLSSTSSLVALVPTILVNTSFSRAFEREADGYALAHLEAAGIDPAHFANLLRRLQGSRGGDEGPARFLSTHPATEERIRRFESDRPGAR